MKNIRKNKRQTQTKQIEKSNQVNFLLSDDFERMCKVGYVKLVDNPEINICVNKIADLISSMTIYLMQNSEKGDLRIKNSLSRKIDINPYSMGSRKSWMYTIVSNLLLYGDGNSVVYPEIGRNGEIIDLIPLDPERVGFKKGERGYNIHYFNKIIPHDEVLHFKIRPDSRENFKGTGVRIILKNVINNLYQAESTRKEFLESKFKPSLIMKVDAMTDEFTTPEGREKLLNKFTSETKRGLPFLIPAGAIDIEQVKPLSLQDLALNDGIELDKRTIAGMFGVPSFFLGVGKFNADEYNNFIDSVVMPIAKEIEQILTSGLLESPFLYFKLNVKSLYSFDFSEMVQLYADLSTKGIVTGNEVRKILDEPPLDELNELKVLENYIPVNEIGNQKKLDNQIKKVVEEGAESD